MEYVKVKGTLRTCVDILLQITTALDQHTYWLCVGVQWYDSREVPYIGEQLQRCHPEQSLVQDPKGSFRPTVTRRSTCTAIHAQCIIRNCTIGTFKHTVHRTLYSSSRNCK